MNNGVLFSHNKDDWGTPDELFRSLHQEFQFKMDLAANAKNTKLGLFTNNLFDVDISKAVSKGSSLWLNPPYGRKVGAFIQKAYTLSTEGYTVVCLLPARTDTKWFHEIVLHSESEIRFIKGRLTFKDAPYSAPFPSMLVIFRPKSSQ